MKVWSILAWISGALAVARPMAAQDEAVVEQLAPVLAAEDARDWRQPLFEKALVAPDSLVRRIAALAAGRIGDLRATPLLLRLLDHYSFVYVNRDLYHFRYHQSNLSHDRNAAVYNKLRRFYTEKALQRWGGHYRCEMVGPPELWQSIRLVPMGRKT